MNKTSSQQSSPELPLPVESEKQLPNQEVFASDSEHDILTRENLTPQQSGPVSNMPMVDPSQIAAPGSPIPDDQTVNVPVAPGHLPASDADVIEKEWVERAKKIVSATSTNPREESAQLNTLKAEYIKKRFGKDVKQANEAA